MRCTGIVFIIICFSFFVYPQVGGSIVYKSTKKPVPYANIYIMGKRIGTTANRQGVFNINALEEEDSLVVSAIGYETSKVQIWGVDSIIHLQ
ncbi:MAG: carboxypeptidase-like regulatory domain-containing protein [Bacteroidales bacterium]